MTDATVPTADKPRKRKQPVPCAASGCNRFASSRGYCTMHYTRLQRHGTLIPKLDFGDPVDRFHRKYAVNEQTGCWEWVC